jgi:hypothetical protein
MVYARVASAGGAVGIAFRFDRIERQPNTFEGHRAHRVGATTRRFDIPRTLSLHYSKAVILLNCEHENYADPDGAAPCSYATCRDLQ